MNTFDKIPKIRVLVRKRPLNKKEEIRGESDIVTVHNNQSIIVKEQKFKVDLTPYIDEYCFNFDGAYNQLATNQQIYASSVRNLIECAFDGARVSCFAYGQTGSGKTHTMLGNGSDVKGLYLLAAEDIFAMLQTYEYFTVWVSFYEIYCGKLYDLLNQRSILFAREDAKSNVNIVGLSERKITNVQNLVQIIQFGTGIRVTAQNGTNVDSSRSHAILQIVLKANVNKVQGKISFIDLAGSQRAADHADQLQKQTRIDGAEINKSLLALKQCIRALDQNKNHTPFRGSKLTMVLKDSFTGYCRSVMIGNISPNSSSCENTLNTLKYADRVKQLKKPNQERVIEFDYLDQLSKELMLPRQFVNIQSHSNQNNLQKKNNNFINSNEAQHHSNEAQHHSNSNNQIISKNSPIREHRQSVPNILLNNSNNKNSPFDKKYRKGSGYSHSNNYNSANINNNNYNSANINNNYNNVNYNKMQSKNVIKSKFMMGHEQDEDTFQELALKHENYIQKIIEEEEELMKSHEKHINLNIELVKKEMQLMGEVDRIGSNIQQYLDNLEEVLGNEINSIVSLQNQVYNMKNHLNQSKKIELAYLKKSEQMGMHVYPSEDQDHEASLLDEDDYLFK